MMIILIAILNKIKMNKNEKNIKQCTTQVKRLSLPHHIPNWIKIEESVYFITICTAPRNKNQLCYNNKAISLWNSIKFYQEESKWFVHLALFMPDHIHCIFSFPQGSSIKKTILNWKRFTANKYKIEWQRDFFEHRIRNAKALEEKAGYILNNPVRAGLAKDKNEWLYVWRGCDNGGLILQSL